MQLAHWIAGGALTLALSAPALAQGTLRHTNCATVVPQAQQACAEHNKKIDFCNTQPNPHACMRGAPAAQPAPSAQVSPEDRKAITALDACERHTMPSMLNTGWQTQAAGYQVILQGNRTFAGRFDALAKENGTIKVNLDGIKAAYASAKQAAQGFPAQAANCEEFKNKISQLVIQARDNKYNADALLSQLKANPNAPAPQTTPQPATAPAPVPQPTAAAPQAIRIVQALYGRNCNTPRADVTAHIAGACNGKPSCGYVVNHGVIGDTAPGCAKNYEVLYECAPGDRRNAAAPAEASGKTVSLSCAPQGPATGITITRALYGANCNSPRADVTAHIAATCNGKPSCAYTVNHGLIGDTAPGCAKDYGVEYQCPGKGPMKAGAPAEASGKTVQLGCQ